MQPAQNSTGQSNAKEVEKIPRPYSQLTLVQRSYVDFKALGGLITDDEGSRFITVQDLADMLQVHRSAIYDSVKYMPNFWDLVADRRKELSGQARLEQMHRKWYLKAKEMKNWQISEAWLRNFDPQYKEAKSKVEVEAGASFAALLDKKRAQPMEGEVVDGPGKTD